MEGDIKKTILKELERDKGIYTNEKIKEIIIDKVLLEARDTSINKNYLINEIYADICGYGLIDELLRDKEITEIMINGAKDIFYEKNGILKKYYRSFEDEKQLDNIIQSMVSKMNRKVNRSNPIVDVRLEDGSRVNIVIKPVAINGPIVTIRKFREDFLKMEDLLLNGSITKEAIDFLSNLVKDKFNIFISGGTSTGKTTFLNLLANFISDEDRIITIEDSAELKIEHNNIVKLEVRKSNVSGLDEISIRDLIKTSLRMRPDRIIVGEVRGEEAFDMLTAMNTGHDGSISTGHANSSSDMLVRLVTMVVVGSGLKEYVAENLIKSSIDFLIHLGREKGKRFVEGIYKMDKDNEKLKLKPIFLRKGDEKLVKVIK